MIVLGIDPGISGGLALVAGPFACPRLLAAIDVPVRGVDARRRVDVGAVLDFIQRTPPDFAVVERAFIMPGTNVAAMAIYMRAAGALEACVEGLGIPWEPVESKAWKRVSGIGERGDMKESQYKELSRQVAIRVFGANPLLDEKGDRNRCEAALIARFGLTMARRVRTSATPG